MTKNEFMGFSSDAQHNMVLEALKRVTKNIEIIENESGRPFADTSKQRMNDIKLLTILADAFSKNELVWNQKTKQARDDILERGAALHTGILLDEYIEKSKPAPWEPLPESMRRGNTKPVVGVVGGGNRITLEEYVKEIIKESRGKNYGKEEK